MLGALHRARCSPTRTTAATPRSPAASSTTARSSPVRTAARTSTPTTPRIGSGVCGSTPTGRHRHVQLRALRRHTDGPYGDIVYLAEGPDGALYYLDLGYSDIGGTFGVSKIRRIKYVHSNQAPVVNASASPTSGAAPLNVTFSSSGSSDPEGQPLTYSWAFGDGATSTAANPSHTYSTAGRLSGAAHRLRRGQHVDLHADHDQRRRRPDGDDLVARPTACSSRPGT